MDDFLPNPDTGCHRTGFKERCRTLVTRKNCKCRRWVSVTGKAMDSTETVTRWDCVDNLQLWALVELGRSQVGTTASIDKFRGEMQEANAQATALRDPDLIDYIAKLPPPGN